MKPKGIGRVPGSGRELGAVVRAPGGRDSRDRRTPQCHAEPSLLLRRSAGDCVGPALTLQRLAGNRAVTDVVLQRVNKPPAPAGLSSGLKRLEKAVRSSNRNAASHQANILQTADPTSFSQLVLYKLDKHRADVKFQRYLAACSVAAKADVFSLACQQHELGVVRQMVPACFFNLTPAQRRAAAQVDPRFFARHVMTLAKEAKPLRMVEVLQDHTLIQLLKASAPADYAVFAGNTPQLAVVEQAGLWAGPGAGSRKIVDEIFAAMIENRGITVAYAPTVVTPHQYTLTGPTQESQRHRAQQMAMGIAIPPIPAMDCHNLLLAFEHILDTYPVFPTPIRHERVTLPHAVLTAPLDRLPGGLIKNFQGNVLRHHHWTKQIFFTGEGGINSHSYLRVRVNQWQAYDLLFGTAGNAVRRAVAGQFAPTARPGVYREVGAGRRFLIEPQAALGQPPLAAPANTYGFMTGYRLTEHPANYGIDPAAL